MPPLTLDDLPPELLQRHERFATTAQDDLALLEQVQSLTDVATRVRSVGGGAHALTIAAADQLGALAVLAGNFAAHGLDIREADLFTVVASADPLPAAPRRAPPRRRPTAPTRPRRLLLDHFLVQPLATLEPQHWAAFEAGVRETLALVAGGALEAAMERVIDGVALRARVTSGSEPLYPVAIELTPEADTTRLEIQSVDSAGFLFEFAAALGALRANVVRAEIRTVDHETRDTFWLTEADGRPVTAPHRLEELRVATTLIKHFTHVLHRAAEPAQALHQFGALVRSLAARPQGVIALGDLSAPEVLETLADLLGVSRFLWEDFLRMQHANLFPVLASAGSLAYRTPRDQLLAESLAAVQPQADDAPESPRRRLNDLKDREMFRTDLRHITGRIGFLEFSRELSDVAEVTVRSAATLVHAELQAAHGEPRLADGGACGWAICALGKFGGRELGYASDIELLFLYEDDGLTDGPRPISNHEYYEAFVRGVRDAITARQEGIFELDLRLRPYGAKGALATSLRGFAEYYREHGPAEQFERMALVRLRPFAGSDHVRVEAVRRRDAWVYSGARLNIDEVLHLRHRQATELTRTGTVNAKYSPGAVVDLEYFVQALQIEHGASHADVRAPGTLEGAELLIRAGLLPPLLGGKLQDAYGFMRRLIDGLRVVRGNAKDLAIPEPGTRAFAYLARRLHFLEPADLDRAIRVRMDFGRSLWTHFEDYR